MESIRNTPIRIYDPNSLRFLGTIEDHKSLIWTRRYYEPGECELHAPYTAKNLKLLRPGNILAKRGDSEAARIRELEIEDSDIKNEITAYGDFLSIYFDWRLAGKTTINFSGMVEVAMRQLITSAAPIPRVQLGALQGFAERVEFQVTMKNLCTYLTKLARSSGIGYRLRPDFKQKVLVFEAYKGVDRTRSQGVNNRVIFSEAYENLNNAIYRYSDQMLRTKVYVAGQGTGGERVQVEIGGGTGLDLREGFVDARDLSGEGLTPAQYDASLLQRGTEKKGDWIITESMECETEADVNFTYKKHYDLGDIVTAEKRGWGITMNSRLTELQEVHQYGGMFVAPTFGDPLPEKIDWSE